MYTVEVANDEYNAWNDSDGLPNMTFERLEDAQQRALELRKSQVYDVRIVVVTDL